MRAVAGASDVVLVYLSAAADSSDQLLSTSVPAMAKSGFSFGNIFAAGPLYGDKPDSKKKGTGPAESEQPGGSSSSTIFESSSIQMFRFEEDQDIKIGRNIFSWPA